MVYNKIPVVFGASWTAVGPAVSYQYDVKQILVINGLDLPEYYEVDFCNKGDAQTITMVGTADGVEIPDELLQTGKQIKAYIVIQGEDEGAVETRFEATLPVNTRPARSDIQPTPAEQTQIDALISALNDGVERSEAAANDAVSAKEDAENAAESAAESAADIDEYKETTDTLSGLFSHATVAVTKRENGATHILNQFFALRAAAICGHYYNVTDAELYVYGFFCCGDTMDHITYYRLDSRSSDAVELTPENAENVTELYSGTGRYYKTKGTAHLADGAHIDYRLCAVAYDANNEELYRLYSDQYRFIVENGTVTRERFDTAPRPSMDVTDFGYVRNTTSIPNTLCRVLQSSTIRPIVTTNQSSKFQWIVQDDAFDTEYGLSLAYRTGDGRVVSGPSFDKAEAGGGGGTTDYTELSNKPSINSIELAGNKTAAQLGLATPSDIPPVPVQSVNGKTGAVVLEASDVGAGTYSKPSGGIPKTDLASAVQTSLGKADSALQSYTETDPTVPSWAKASSKPSYTASEVGAVASNQGVANAGKFMVVGSDGVVTPVAMSAWAGGSY